ncbi:MAG TPA: molybdopterin-binding protein [Alkalispirochaeta sp.]|nr:molybdopterin-binding protein [Alkalispirochaeta sp.]
MNLSARNQLPGVVTSITQGAVNSEVVVEVAPNVEITAVITKSSAERLGLGIGSKVYAVVKASNVMVATD